MSFWRDKAPRKSAAEERRTAEALAAFEASFDGGSTKSFVLAGSGATYQPTMQAAPPAQPHRAQKKGLRAMDEFLEELKARDTLRDKGFTLDKAGPRYHAPQPEEKKEQYQGTTNLVINNMAPTVTEETIMKAFGAYGEIFSVKVMWPRSDDERRRGRNRGFVSFRQRDEAEDAQQAMDDSVLEGVRISVAWGRALKDQPGAGGVGSTAASRSAYGARPPKTPALPGAAACVAAAVARAKLLAAPAPRVAAAAGGASAFQGAALSTRRSRWDSLPAKREDGLSQQDFEGAHKVIVVVPQDDTLRRLADLTARFVAADGRTFEDFLRLRERNHADFSKLLDSSSSVGRYYRYRTWEAAMASKSPEPGTMYDFEGRQVKAFRIQCGGPFWVAPDQATTASPVDDIKDTPALTRADALRKAEQSLMERSRENEASLYERRGARRGDAKLRLNDVLRFTETLASMHIARTQIKDAMCFALDRADAARELSELLGNALTEPAQAQASDETRLARLYVASDILHNAAACGRGARMMRSLLRPYLAPALHHLGTRLLGRSGSTLQLAATNSIIDKVGALLQVWSRWAQVFPANWTYGLESAFFERRERSSHLRTEEDDDDGHDALRRDARIAGLYDGSAPLELRASLARLRPYIKHRTLGVSPAEALRAAQREHAEAAQRAAPAIVESDEDVDGEACDDVDDLLADVAEASIQPFPVAAPHAPVAPPAPVAAPPVPVAAPPAARLQRPPSPQRGRSRSRGRRRGRSRSRSRSRRRSRRHRSPSSSSSWSRSRSRRRSLSRRRR
jgi:U2-associated protein SR140